MDLGIPDPNQEVGVTVAEVIQKAGISE